MRTAAVGAHEQLTHGAFWILVWISQLLFLGRICPQENLSWCSYYLEDDYLRAFVLCVSPLCSVLFDLNTEMHIGNLSLSIYFH